MRIRQLQIILTILLASHGVEAQEIYWQQKVDHRITVALEEKGHMLDGYQEIHYHNNSPDTLRYIWFHLWPNAYRNDRTAFSEQLLQQNRTDFYFSEERTRGYINRLDFKVNGITSKLEDHPQHQDIARLVLPEALVPGGAITITTPFQVKLPYLFSRSGHRKKFYSVTQWYPKPAVYDRDGWHPMPYLDNGEFYNEFGDYDIRISVPDGYKVAATGRELSTEQPHTYHYQQDNITDFAWFASREFITVSDTVRLNSGKTVRLTSYYRQPNAGTWEKSLDYLKRVIRKRSEWIGEYPYDHMKLVDGYQAPGIGGMEYPTITVINNEQDAKALDLVIAHETGHNWFQGSIASHERRDAWLDEGLNSYYDNRYQELYYGKRKDTERSLIRLLESLERNQPVTTAADSFRSGQYGLMAYSKTAWWLEELEQKTGRRKVDSLMHAYYSRYGSRHVNAAGFRDLLQEVMGLPATVFHPLDTRATLDTGKKTWKPAFLFHFKEPLKYRYLFASPAVGYNHYDALMPGLMLHNYQAALPRFRFFMAGMYGTRSSAFTGISNLNYNWYPQGKIGYIMAGLDLSRFSVFRYENAGPPITLQYNKISPYLRLQLAEKSSLSKKQSYLQLKSFFFREDALAFNTIIDGPDTSYTAGKKTGSRNLQQLKLYHANHRVLYPYELSLVGDVGKDFTRIGFTSEYYFNYREGGLQTRLFGGKFIYHGAPRADLTFSTDRYHLNLTGANGYEDYTYSGYFPGRNEYEGWMSQQIMLRDGGFKMRSDLYSNKIGKTDNWLVAVNLSSDIPRRFNPLTLLPVKIPLKVFADIGTFAEAWENDSKEGRVYYDAGLQLSLFSGILNIYAPLFMSKPFRTYRESVLGEKKFLKSLSFSFDIQKVSAAKIFAKAGL